MRTQSLLTLFFLIGLGLSWAEGTPTSTPTPVPTPDPSSPTPTRTPLLAPDWAPTSVGTEPGSPERKKPSPWMSLTGIGMGFPLSPNLGRAYSPGFYINLGTGLRVTDQFSLWISLDLDTFNSSNDSLTGSNNFTLIDAAFWARYRILPSGLSPYLFMGPGVSYNENRNNKGPLYNPATYYAYIPVNAYEVDLLLEGGLGLDLRIAEGFHAFLQTKVSCDFTSSQFAGYAFNDSPLWVMPLEIGVLVGM